MKRDQLVVAVVVTYPKGSDQEKKSFATKVVRNKKIRIGYVLKSADVGTLFSRRNSENSSHPRMCTWVCAGVHKCAGVYPGVCGCA